MASATPPFILSLNHTSFTTPKHHTQKFTVRGHSLPSMSSFHRRSDLFPPSWSQLRRRSKGSISSAYITGPASDPIFSDNDPKIDDSSFCGENEQPPTAISWGLLWSLLARHKLRLAVSILTLVSCTTCTLSMPIFSGRFFEVLIGVRPEPLWKLLSKVGVLYALEPVFTVIFVVNMTTIWEKVMSNLRAQIFQRVLIQKVEFFDRYKGRLSYLWKQEFATSIWCPNIGYPTLYCK